MRKLASVQIIKEVKDNKPEETAKIILDRIRKFT